MAKSTPLEQLQAQAELPPTKLGRVLAATPVVMTVIATLLAGLASSEMTKAQYERAYAAQLQSRAGDQWAFFQAKRLRGEMQRNTLDVLQVAPTGTELAPEPPAAEPLAPEVAKALKATREEAPPVEMNAALIALDHAVLSSALKEAKDRAVAYDAMTAPIQKGLEAASGPEATVRRLAFNAARYDREARLNADIARLYELQVRKTNLQAERHHLRSQRFFFGMLAAQAAVIVATFALAARKKNLLWGLAAGAGALAVAFAIYVYLYV
jgi:hypothetical protein